MSIKSIKRDRIFVEILEGLGYDPLEELVAVGKELMKFADEADENDDKLKFLSLKHKIDVSLLDKLHANKKSIEIDMGLDVEDLPKLGLSAAVQDEGEYLKEDPPVLH